MDPLDSLNSSLEITALYTRHNGNEMQVRLDLLELDQAANYDLFLEIDTHSDGAKPSLKKNSNINNDWDFLIHSDSNGNLEAIVHDPILKIEALRVTQNSDDDTVTISFTNNSNRKMVDTSTNVMAWIQPHGSPEIADSIGPVNFTASPQQQANVMLYFWDTFSAATPAQALRHWDGAHAGPNSARHGLKHLLDAVESTNIPVILSDLNTPANLSALDYLGVLNAIRQMANSNQVIMPAVSSINLSDQPAFSLPGSIFIKELAWDHQVSLQFRMPESQVLVADQWPISLDIPSNYHFIFPKEISVLSSAKICINGQIRLLCQFESMDVQDAKDPFSQVDERGITLEAKKRLVEIATSDKNSILVLGGDLGLSAWGIKVTPTRALSYLRSHPWIHVLSLNDLLSWKASSDASQFAFPVSPGLNRPFIPETLSEQPIASGLNTDQINHEVLARLEELPDNEISGAIWQWYFGLLSADSIERHRLNAATLGQIGHLFAAEKWYEQLYERSDCSTDIDWDGENECILSSNNFFASFDVQGGQIVIGLVRTTNGLQQVIAPTYQVFSGLSDPFRWKTDLGFAGDPDAGRGSFIERANTTGCCMVSFIGKNAIEFNNDSLSMRKIYTLLDTSLEVSYQVQQPTQVIGFVVDNPWNRFTLKWADKYLSPAEFMESPDLLQKDISITTNGELTKDLFTASREYLDAPEDPNFDYGAGHYLIFPFASFAVTGTDQFWIRLQWQK